MSVRDLQENMKKKKQEAKILELSIVLLIISVTTAKQKNQNEKRKKKSFLYPHKLFTKYNIFFTHTEQQHETPVFKV